MHVSIKVTNGGLEYPDPPESKSTPAILPALSITALPNAPKPPPPNISTVGGPHSNAAVLH